MGAGAPTPKVVVLTYYFCQKLHEDERIRTGGASLGPPGSANGLDMCREQSNLNEGYDYFVKSCLLSSTVSDGLFCQQTAEWKGEILSIKV